MSIPLSADFGYRVLWHDDAGAPSLEPERSITSAVDVVVIGAGLCGLAAARRLSDAGRSVVVLEREPLGFGASTRSGGMVLPELHAPPAVLVRRHGELGSRLWAAGEAAFDRAEALAAALELEGTDAAYRRTGQLVLARGARAAARLRGLRAGVLAGGAPARVIEGEELREEVASAAFAAGAVVERAGGLHPARFHAGLARRALAAGAEVHDRTPVIAVDRRPGGGWRVYTNRSRVECGEVVVAANATVDGAFDGLRRRVLPVASYVIATEPLDPGLAASLSPRGRMFVDTRHLVTYWRLSPDGRMVFGGRRDLRPTSPDAARDHLARAMAAIHPQLAEVPISHAWCGHVAITADRLPHCGRRDGVWFATGCNGSGVAMMPWLGEQLADALAGEGPMPPFAELAHRRIPMWSLRDAYMPVVGDVLRLADRLPTSARAR